MAGFAGEQEFTTWDGEPVSRERPVYAEDTLVQVAHWLRGFHHAVAEFVPPAGAVGRMGGQWAPGLIIGHNDATGCAGEQLCNIKER